MRRPSLNNIGRSVLLALAINTIAATGLSTAVSAQEFRASISGSVRDGSGAKVVAAAVVATNTQTQEIFQASSNQTGDYTLSLLPIGTYQVKADHAGFKTEVQSITLHGGDRAQLDFGLSLGSTAEAVTVSAVAPMLEVTSGDSGQTITATQVHDLPLLGRNPFTLALLTPGVEIPPGQAPSTALRPFDNGGMDSFQVNGGRSLTTEYMIDGLTDSAVDTGSPANLAFVPSPDMTAEFRVQTNTYDAQYGRSGAGFISVNLKSGTNAIHGVAYDYVRNEAFNANDYQDDVNHVRKGKFRWSQPGLEVDGPVIIPKLYNGRDKTFFMFGWEEISTSIPASGYFTVPTALERSGDFSQSLNGGPLTIYDPLTTKSNGAGGYTRTAFQGNKIPSNRLDAVGQAILTHIPLPNLPSAGNVNNLFVSPNSSTDRYDSFAYRVDHVINANHRIFFSYLQSDRHQTQGTNGYPIESTSGYLHFRRNYGAHVDWSWVISPSLLSSLRAGWIEHRFDLGVQDTSFNVGSLGFPSATVAGLATPNIFPLINLANYSGAGNGFQSGLVNDSDNYDLRETLIKNWGSHVLSFGGEYRPMRDNRAIFAAGTTFNFGRDFTQANPQAGDASSGSSIASLLLGYPDGGSTSTSPKPMYRYNYSALFIQDNWRVNKQLTLTAGLRWDVETPLVDQHHQQTVGFNPGATYTFAGVPLHGTLQYAGQGRYSDSNTDYNNFGPRVGFAFSPNSKFVIRGGAGVLYSPAFDPPSSVGFGASTPYVASNDNLLTPANTLSNPFPSGFAQATGTSTNINGQGGWSYYPSHVRQTPRTTQYSLGVQYSVRPETILDVKYVGQLLSNIPAGRNVNFPSVATLALGNALNNQVANPFAGQLPGTFLNGPTYSLLQSMLPYPQYSNFTAISNNLNSSYNGLQVRVENRLRHGLSLLLAYTYAKTIQEGYLNDQDTYTSTWVDPAILPQTLSIAGTYHLPFFEGSTNHLLKETLAGWQMNVIYTASSGLQYAAPGGVQDTGVDPRLANPTRAHMFKTCTLTTAGVRQNCNGSEPVVWTINQPFTLNHANPWFGGLRVGIPPNVNLSLFKSFPIYRRLNLEFRAESFNLTNTPQFNAPDTGVNSPTFGQLTNLSQINDPRNIQFALRLSF